MSSTIEITKTCEWCGNKFIARKCTTRYCSKRCAEHAYKGACSQGTDESIPA